MDITRDPRFAMIALLRSAGDRKPVRTIRHAIRYTKKMNRIRKQIRL